MKRLIITLLSLGLALFGWLQVQGEEMQMHNDKAEAMRPADTMMKQETMQGGEMMKDEVMIPSDAELRKRLTPLQYEVTRRDGTEPAFKNAYWDNHEPGIYVDIISGVPLFSSLDKYDSGTGWPSFTRPLDIERIVAKEDRSFFMTRTEVRGKASDAHLGHVFNDGPAPNGLRYCMNSASLRFVHKDDLAKQGYAEYEKLFK